MIEDYFEKLYSFDNKDTDPVTRRKKDDWNLWAIILAFAGISAVLLMVGLFSIMALA